MSCASFEIGAMPVTFRFGAQDSSQTMGPIVSLEVASRQSVKEPEAPDVKGDGLVNDSEASAVAQTVGRSTPLGGVAAQCRRERGGLVTAFQMTPAARSTGRNPKSELALG
jgi:hypothetical protein